MAQAPYEPDRDLWHAALGILFVLVVVGGPATLVILNFMGVTRCSP